MKVKNIFFILFMTGLIAIPAFGILFENLALGIGFGALLVSFSVLIIIISIHNVLKKKFNLDILEMDDKEIE